MGADWVRQESMGVEAGMSLGRVDLTELRGRLQEGIWSPAIMKSWEGFQRGPICIPGLFWQGLEPGSLVRRPSKWLERGWWP